jgi:chloramphenicol 3-O phosphotransferase
VVFEVDHERTLMSAELPSRSTHHVDVIVLNGPSSSGKTTLAHALQDVLDDTWLVFGIDTLISALPLSLLDIHPDATIGAHPRDHLMRDGGISFDAVGAITVGAEFQRLESAWLKGLAAIAGQGVQFILDEVFLDGAHSQDRLRHALAGYRVAWIGVTCDLDVLNKRERERGDRVVGEAEGQSRRVHDGVRYDLVVDTTSRSADEVAREIETHLSATPA